MYVCKARMDVELRLDSQQRTFRMEHFMFDKLQWSILKESKSTSARVDLDRAK